MVVLSFSVDALLPKILAREKTRSMRPATSKKWLLAAAKWGLGKPVTLHIYWKSRSPTQSRLLFTTPLLCISRVKLSDLTEAEARLDGFTSLAECRAWFTKTYKLPSLDFDLFMIEWGDA